MRLLSKIVFLLVLCLGTQQLAFAEYPERPVTAIVPFPAGGTTDTQLRILQKFWSRYTPEKLSLVHAAGAAGMIGFNRIAHAQPDGYTIGVLSFPHVALQTTDAATPFTCESFSYICQAVREPLTLVVRQSSSCKTLKEFIDFALKNPRLVRIGLVGPKTGHHMMLLDLQKQIQGFCPTQVFLKGTAELRDALASGRIDALILNAGEALDSASFRTLAVASGERLGGMLSVPTFSELGYDIVADIRRGYVAPAGLKPEVLKALNTIFEKICHDPEYQEAMRSIGQVPDYLAGEDFFEAIRTDTQIVRGMFISMTSFKK